MAPISTWKVDEAEFPHLDAAQCASLLTTGNGTLCTRGTPAEQRFGASRGTYHTGLYTLAPGGIPYLLCTPDWTPAWVSVAGALPNVSESRRVLDMEKGVLRRSAILEAGEFRLRIEEERFASFVKPNLVCQRMQLFFEHGTAKCEVSMGLDGEVRNQRDRYYPDPVFPICDETGLRLSAIERCECDLHAQRIVLRVPATGVRTMAVARITSGTEYESLSCRGGDGRTMVNFDICPGPDESPLQFDKVAVVTADMPDENDAVSTGGRLFEEYAGLSYAEARIEHTNSVRKFWENADVQIEGDESAQRAVRYSIWSTRIAAPNNGGGSSIGARNLCGDALRGGVYWDSDLLRMPFLSAVAPERAANHIRYRAKSLAVAKRRAAIDGYLGANFPYASRTVDHDSPYAKWSHRTVFVNVSIARGILHYFSATHDESLMFESGLRLLLEICLYLTSRIRRREDQYYGFASVEGPEGSSETVDDEVFTNAVGAWVLRQVPRIVERLGQRQRASVESLIGALGIKEKMFRDWDDIADHMWIPERGTFRFEQQPREVLEGPLEGDLQNAATEIPLKVPGILLLHHVGIPITGDVDDWRVYARESRSGYASAQGVLASVAVALGYWEDAGHFFEMISRLDSPIITSGGIDGPALTGLWTAIVQGLGGMRVENNGVSVDPKLPPDWSRLTYRFLYRGIPLEVDVESEQVRVTNLGSAPTRIEVAGKSVEIPARETHTAAVHARWRSVGLKAVFVTLETLFPGLGTEELSSPRLLAESVKKEISGEIRQILGTLKASGISIGVIVNQPSSEPIIAQLRLREVFDTITVVPSGISKDLRSTCLTEAAHRLGVLPIHCALISGSSEYAAAGRNMGMIPIGVATDSSSDFRKTYASFNEIDLDNLMKPDLGDITE